MAAFRTRLQRRFSTRPRRSSWPTMSSVVGIGIDLTQHIPLVTAALCPEPVSRGSTTGASALLHYWPPRVGVRVAFHSQVASSALPLMPGDPVIARGGAPHQR